MIKEPLILLPLFIAIVWLVLKTSRVPKLSGIFKYLPVPLWCYFIPTILTTLGVLSPDNAFYSQMSRTLLPACLFLMLIGTDLPAILKLSPKALGAMAAGTAGIWLGGAVTFLIAQKMGPGRLSDFTELWKGWGCLGATWTGGSANMLAAKEILLPPDGLFSNLIVTDTLTAYSWMAFLVFASRYQERIDRALKAEFPEEHHGLPELSESDDHSYKTLFGVGLLGFAAGTVCSWVSRLLPPLSSGFDQYTWTIVLATLLPLLLSMTKARNCEAWGANRAGLFLLYLLLTSIGARADLSCLRSAPFFAMLGLLWVLIHGVILLVFARVFRVPVAILAAASQANVGGPASTSIVAGIYRKELTSVGILLAVLGGIYGTPAGIFLSQICRRLLHLLQSN